ncbi:hypothetical protein PF005_g1353 [Phytophthora fragariae]|uniref:Uncharacterized protein n=1 Tax=Phytophthora fragariae TaxID=53985 RepID=A0A6A3UW99_9STRA|nr:hypothetical protein PF010_g1085 [Phytophthora fragariae]KAE9154916.1 hypothetical protein PF006_g1115 [Phytophthora fragariae]KAE9235705.1 hypothetical protein PF005_g1353 [Phytophthora fragariae]KAE9257215.1 hypothetical protein PF002_g1239 [Phytophthora fragariae]
MHVYHFIRTVPGSHRGRITRVAVKSQVSRSQYAVERLMHRSSDEEDAARVSGMGSPCPACIPQVIAAARQGLVLLPAQEKSAGETMPTTTAGAVSKKPEVKADKKMSSMDFEWSNMSFVTALPKKQSIVRCIT